MLISLETWPNQLLSSKVAYLCKFKTRLLTAGFGRLLRRWLQNGLCFMGGGWDGITHKRSCWLL